MRVSVHGSGVPGGAAVDPGVHRRGGRARDARRAGRGRVHRAGAAPLPAVALRRDRHRGGQARPRHGHGRAVARRPRPPTASRPSGSTSSSTRRTASSWTRRRSCSRASPGTGSTATPTPTRQRAEWGMALLSLGAAVENLMVAAADAGLASCWVAAPIFCPEAARDALALPRGVAPPRARARRPPGPRLRRPAAPADPARSAAGVPVAVQRPPSRCALNHSSVLVDAGVEVGPRLPAEVDLRATGVERRPLELARRAPARCSPLP